MELLWQGLQLHSPELLAYCLMSNHVHLLLIPAKADAMARALKDVHGRYAAYWNASTPLGMFGRDDFTPAHWTSRISGKLCGTSNATQCGRALSPMPSGGSGPAPAYTAVQPPTSI